ncbi:elongator complex protein 6 [Battus philenor]|uniref:elongator complex protein 6 n=1 Tax=Battus philenor TaxID=42288 RepID=UPI0035D0CE0A
MSSDVVSVLELDKVIASSRALVIKEINNCDGSFITSSILGHFIKNKKAVLIISTHNSIKHYQNVGLKMNYNLNRGMDNGYIEFYNIGDEYVNKMLKNEYLVVEKLFQSIKNKFECLQMKHGSVNVIFDGVSHFLDMHFNLREVNMLCSMIIDLTRSYNSLFICQCNVASEHDVTQCLANLLSHKAYMVLEVENLASGWSTDASGHLTIKYPGKKFECDQMFVMNIKATEYLFKLFDRGVKLLAPGTV